MSQQRRLARLRGGPRGFTLIEVLVSIGIIAVVGALIYAAFRGMSHARDNMVEVSDRNQHGRQALERMARELESAFLSVNLNFQQLRNVRQTTFVGTKGRPDRVDFTAFAHRRLSRDAHESDQAEISYFAARSPDGRGLDLVRRLDQEVDDDPARGGIVQVLVEGIEDFALAYLDPVTREWQESWDSTQPAAQLGRLPSQIHIVLVLGGGPGGAPVRFETKVALPMQLPLGLTTN